MNTAIYVGQRLPVSGLVVTEATKDTALLSGVMCSVLTTDNSYNYCRLGQGVTSVVYNNNLELYVLVTFEGAQRTGMVSFTEQVINPKQQVLAMLNRKSGVDSREAQEQVRELKTLLFHDQLSYVGDVDLFNRIVEKSPHPRRDYSL